MRFKSRIGFLEMLRVKPCQIIGITGFIKYRFVWCYDDVVNFGIHEYTTGLFIAAGDTLEQAQKNAEIQLRLRAVDIDKAIKVRDKINDVSNYGFSRKPE